MSRFVAPKGTETTDRFVAPKERSADQAKGVLKRVKKLVKGRNASDAGKGSEG